MHVQLAYDPNVALQMHWAEPAASIPHVAQQSRVHGGTGVDRTGGQVPPFLKSGLGCPVQDPG